jgi:hypothetical protein
MLNKGGNYRRASSGKYDPFITKLFHPPCSPLDQPNEERAFAMNFTDNMVETQRNLPSWMKRKEVTNFTLGTYKYQDCIDKILAGIWKRTKGFYQETSLAAPVSTLTKLLIWQRARRDATISNNKSPLCWNTVRVTEYWNLLEYQGFNPRLLAIRHQLDRSLRARIALHFVSLPWFWCFTCWD